MNPIICVIGIERIIDLRWRILRSGLPRESADFPGDLDPKTLHLAAMVDDSVVGCASFMANSWNNAPARQLRGMAVDEPFQHRGIGAAMLRFAEREILDRGYSRQLWCNARVPAMNFYQNHGWRIESEPFDIPGAGAHVKMTRLLSG